MADNTRLNARTTDGDLIATDDIGGVKHQRVKVQYGDDGSATDVSQTNPMPVSSPAISAFSTATLLADAATFDSGWLDARGYSQVQTNVTASHDGTLQFIFANDAVGSDIVRTLTLPYVAANGYQLYSAPAFSNYIKYTFTNNGGAPQTDFYYETKLLSTSLSPQVLRVDAPMAGAMMSTVQRAVQVGKQPDGDYVNSPADGAAFASTTPLGSGGNYTSDWVDTDGWKAIEIVVTSDVISATDGFLIEFTDDVQGSQTVRVTQRFTFADADVTNGYLIVKTGTLLDGFRVNYTNGASVQGSFYIEATLRTSDTAGFAGNIESEIGPTTIANVGRSVITGQIQGYDYQNVGVTDEGSLLFATLGSQSAFGDLVTVQPNAEISLMAAYTLDTLNATIFSGGTGTVVANNSQIELATGTTTLSDAAIASKDFITYKPGFGATARFTWGVTTAGDLTGSFQQAGMGTQEDGYFLSYHDNEMNILTRKGGQRHMHRFTITTESTSAGTVGIELDGTTYNVSVSNNTGSTNATAAEIAADAQFALQGGTTTWIAYAEGNEVTFISERTGAKAGAFSFSAGTTGSAATVTAQVTGAAETTTTIPRTSWNLDLCDGTMILPLIDWSKGNVFQIRYQWLGYGAVTFFIENPVSGNLVPVHRIEYANTNTTPSVFNPSLNFLANVANALTTLDVTSFVASVMASSDGGDANKSGTVHANTWGATVGNTDLDAIVSFRFPQYFASKTNRSTARILRLTITASSAADIKILRNATLGGSGTWTSLGTGFLAETDQASTTATGGTIVYADRAEQKDRFIIEAHSAGLDELVKAYPGDVITIAAQADSGTSVINVAVNWVENV